MARTSHLMQWTEGFLVPRQPTFRLKLTKEVFQRPNYLFFTQSCNLSAHKQLFVKLKV